MFHSNSRICRANSASSMDEPFSSSDNSQLGSLYSNSSRGTLEYIESEVSIGLSSPLSEHHKESNDVFVSLASYCLEKIERLQEELINTQECLETTNSQLEDTKSELSAALHDLDHQKRMREHQQHAMDRIIESKTALEAKLDELESLLENDMNAYVRFQQQTRQCISTFEEEIHSLRSELFEAKRSNLLLQLRHLTLTDEVDHLTALNSLLRQKITTLESQVTDTETQHNTVGARQKEETKSYQSKISTLEKQYFYFKSKYTEIQRQHTETQSDLTVMRSIIKGKDAELKKLKEKLQSIQSTNAVTHNWMLTIDKEKMYGAISDAFAQLRISKEVLTKVV